jgi:hypothetical protein
MRGTLGVLVTGALLLAGLAGLAILPARLGSPSVSRPALPRPQAPALGTVTAVPWQVRTKSPAKAEPLAPHAQPISVRIVRKAQPAPARTRPPIYHPRALPADESPAVQPQPTPQPAPEPAPAPAPQPSTPLPTPTPPAAPTPTAAPARGVYAMVTSVPDKKAAKAARKALKRAEKRAEQALHDGQTCNPAPPPVTYADTVVPPAPPVPDPATAQGDDSDPDSAGHGGNDGHGNERNDNNGHNDGHGSDHSKHGN